jgi:hypothetical protein
MALARSLKEVYLRSKGISLTPTFCLTVLMASVTVLYHTKYSILYILCNEFQFKRTIRKKETHTRLDPFGL